MISGIYVITNTINGHYYGGSSVNIFARWSAHKHMARNGSRKSPYFYNALRKYDEQSFECKPIIICSKEHLELFEQRWLDKYYGNLKCYNKSPNADVPFRGAKHTEKTKKLLSELAMGRIPWNKGIPRTKQEKLAISVGTKNAMKNVDMSMTEDRRIKISHGLKGRVFSKETLKRMSDTRKGMYVGKNNPMYGKRHSAETKRKISEAAKKRRVLNAT